MEPYAQFVTLPGFLKPQKHFFVLLKLKLTPFHGHSNKQHFQKNFQRPKRQNHII